jgi:excisionase family DNA binding protein
VPENQQQFQPQPPQAAPEQPAVSQAAEAQPAPKAKKKSEAPAQPATSEHHEHHMAAPTMVRMELMLSPEQLSALFKAVVATQHSVMTLREAASYLRINPATLEEMAKHGDLAAFMLDGRWRFPKSGLDEWVTLNTFRKEDADAA